MENVLSAVIVLFLFLFAGFTLCESMIDSQETVAHAEILLEERLQEQSASALTITAANTTGDGMQITLSLYNEGTRKLADFRHWDLILQYTDTNDALRLTWTPYADGAFPTWTIQQITVGDQPERYEPNVLNPGETAFILIDLPRAVKLNTALNVVISTENAATAARTFPRNVPPALTTIRAPVMAQGGTQTLTSDYLHAVDPDDSDETITYTVAALPTQGHLSMTAFTQADIDAGAVIYTHSGASDDSFAFTLSDGKDSTAAYTLPVFISAPPQLIFNVPMALSPGETGTIYNNMLRADDSDDSINEVIYTVIVPPTQGTLSLGASFTQAAIDAMTLTYTHTGRQSDQFSFTMTDGETVIGPFVYSIEVTPP